MEGAAPSAPQSNGGDGAPFTSSQGCSRLLSLRALSLVLSLSLVFLLEFLLFDQVGAHRVTGIFPRWNDQIQYLSEAYTGFEFARVHGLLAGLWRTLVNPSAQGTLHDFAAVIIFQFAGASRSAALALNMFALIAWQAALFAAVRDRGASRGIAFAAAMLPVALRGPWLILPGSAYDFRLDHLAMCALGVTSAVAVLSRGARRRGWSVACGAATGVTLLTRFLTGTYFILILVALAGWIAVGTERRRRLANLCIAAGLAAGLAAPIFWLNRESLWNYYYIGHYVGPESAIRNQNFGLVRSSQFIWGWLAERHVGGFFFILVAVVALALLVVRTAAKARAARPSGPLAGTSYPPAARRRTPVADIGVVGIAFLLAPAVILTLHPQKSDVVLSALVPGAVLLVITVWLTLAENPTGTPRWAGRTMSGVAVAAGVTALVYFARAQFTGGESPATLATLRQVNTVADYILTQSEAAKLERPRIAVDYITDAFDAQVLRVVCYERHHVWIDFDMRLPTGITAPDPHLVQERVRESDFVFLLNDDQPFGDYPYDRELRQLRPQLRGWCDDHLRRAMQFAFFGHPVVLYQRPSLAAVR